MFNWRTNEEMLVCLKYEARTRENSVEGDMTKLSLPLDHEMRCWMERSSSMLELSQQGHGQGEGTRKAMDGRLTCRACG